VVLPGTTQTFHHSCHCHFTPPRFSWDICLGKQLKSCDSLQKSCMTREEQEGHRPSTASHQKAGFITAAVQQAQFFMSIASSTSLKSQAYSGNSTRALCLLKALQTPARPTQASPLWRAARLVSITDKHQPWAKGNWAGWFCFSYTNFVDGGTQAWYEGMLKEGFLCWRKGPVLAAEQNLEGHSAHVKPFAS